MRLTVNSEVHQQVGIVVATGEIDLATVPGFRQAISDHLAAGLTLLVLDISAVTFMDSTGLGVLVGAGKKAQISGFHDATGDVAANAELALRRAQTVRDVLVGLGVPANQVAMKKPEATTGSGSTAQARRVEVSLVD